MIDKKQVFLSSKEVSMFSLLMFLMHLITYSVNSQGNLNDIEIEYRVEHQAKFLLKTQQAPTLRWFSSQDGLDKLFEKKSQISSDTTNLTKQHDFEKLSSKQSGPPPSIDDNNDGLIGTVATPFPSITDASSVPEINVLGVYHRTRAQASSSPELLTDTSTSLRSEENETQCSSQVCDQISIRSTSLDILSEEEILEHDENIHDNVRWSGNSTTDSCVEGPVISQDCQTTLFALQQRKELTQTKSEPKLVHCSKNKLPGSSNSDTHRQEAVAVRSAPILPSERTVFKTDDNIILVVEGQKVHVSKVLLSLHSEFFKAMFATDMKESQQSEIG